MRSQKSRSRGNKSRNNNNNRPTGNVVNRVFDSSGPEGKVRGTPQQIIDKYQQLHRDAQLSNDRVAAENFQQHAEHYTRILGDALREQEARREAQEAQHRERQQNQNRDDQKNRNQGGDAATAAQQNQHNEQSANREPAQRHNTPRTEAPRDPGSEDQPDVIDLKGDDNADSGLVETVENTPKPARKPRAPRKPRVKDADDNSALDVAAPTDENIPAPKPRAPRKRKVAKAPETSGPDDQAAAE